MDLNLTRNRSHRRSPDKSLALYQLAKRKAWDVDTDLDWLHLQTHSDFPFSREGNLFAGYSEYESLDLQQQIDLAWLQHLQDISDILYGERAALILTAQVLAALEDDKARLFLASQIFDEARHVEFFTRYQTAISRQAFTPARELVNFFNEVAAVQDADAKLLACQAVLEPLAMIRFRLLRRHTSVPLLRVALGYIGRDEARHTEFGTDYLAVQFQKLSPPDKQIRTQQFYRQARLLGDNPARYLNIAAIYQFDPHLVLAHLRCRRSTDRFARQQLQQQMQMSLLKMNLPVTE